MRTKLFYAALALSGAAAIGLSKDTGPQELHARAPYDHHEHGHEAAEKAMRDYYGTIGQVHVLDSFEVNGVKVFRGVVVRDGAEAMCAVTAGGELMTMGVPEPLEVLAPGARETAHLFKAPPTAVSREDIHSYFVEVKGPMGLPYNVEFDAAGRIRNIKSAEEIMEDSVAEDARGPIHHKMSDLTRARFANITISGVYKAKHDPGYYHVSFRDEHGRSGWATINPENDVPEFRAPYPHDRVPEAVLRSIDRDLRGNKVVNVQMGACRLYSVKQMVGGEAISMLIKPNGAVEWINTRELHRQFLVAPGH